MTKLLLILSLTGLVIACATPRPVRIADEEGKYRIDCSGRMFDWEDCDRIARDICGEQTYEIEIKSLSKESIVSKHTDYDDDTGVIREMTIRCIDEPEIR